MKFSAICLSNHEATKTGFCNKEDAKKYIEGCLCHHCKEDLKKGYHEYEFNGNIEREDVLSVSDTACGAEWVILEDEKFEKCEDFADIMEALGAKNIKLETLSLLVKETNWQRIK